MKKINLTLFLVACSGCVAFAAAPGGPRVLTLAAAQETALKNHPQVAAADYLALAAHEVAKEARAGYYPSANLFVDAAGADDEGNRITAEGLNNPSIYDRVAGGASISQLIYDFGRTGNLASGSKLEAQAQDQNAAATREQVLLQVTVNFFNTLEAQAVLRVAQQTFDTRQLLFGQINTLASNQLKSELDVSFARVALQEAKLLLQKAQNNADTAMASLSTALGYGHPQSFLLVEPSAPAVTNAGDDSGLIEAALVQRPELVSLHDASAAALRFAKAARDSRLPTISAVGVAGIAPIHNDHLQENYAAGGVELDVPLFAGGLYTARQHAAELKAEADDALLHNLENIIVRDVHIAWINVNEAEEEIQTTKELVLSAGESYSLAEARYKIGSSSIVELSQAQLDLVSAQISDVNARYNLLIQQTNLDYQTGALR